MQDPSSLQAYLGKGEHVSVCAEELRAQRGVVGGCQCDEVPPWSLSG